jgi:hypothetical protein
MKKKMHVNFLTDPLEGRSTLKPTDVLVYKWVGGKHACLDFTEVSPIVRLTTEDYTVGHMILKLLQAKWSNSIYFQTIYLLFLK